MNILNEQNELKAKRDQLKDKLAQTLSRVESLPDEIQAIQSTLIEQVINGKADFKKHSATIAILELEQKVLPIAADKLKKDLSPIQSRLESIGIELSDIETKERENRHVQQIKKMQSDGQSLRTIRSNLGLDEREFDRLCAAI